MQLGRGVKTPPILLKAGHMADWMLFDCCAITGRKKYMKIEDGLMHIRETMPVDAILEANKIDANEWQDNGGWGKAKKYGAVVARVPLILDNQFKKAAGFDPRKGDGYDRDKYNSFLDDIDNRLLRTGGGKIGKRTIDAPMLSQRLKKTLAAKPLPVIAPILVAA